MANENINKNTTSSQATKGDIDTGTFFGGENDDSQSTLEFFQSLDIEQEKEMNSSPNQATSTEKPSNSGTGTNTGNEPSLTELVSQIDELKKELKTVTKRYGDSSSEALKIKSQLNEYAPYLPILEKMKSDEGLVRLMRTRIENADKPQSPIEILGLDDDFVLDLDKAVKEPNSDHGKVLKIMIQNAADERVSLIEQKRNIDEIEREQRRQFENFVKEKKLSEEDRKAFEEFSNNHRLTYDDILFLMKRNDIAKEIARRTREETIKQMKKARMLNADSLGSESSVLIDTKDDDVFFNEIFGDREGGFFG